ncbi:hypothetical protein H2199_008574 [Coniosporium tulheliwenetii]|uniref:Uncharacterized protein n=1 Tax=Coniosporium tulheliwenetii TaxID=3383036 RepID=A0ACC2YIC6_9PEZI|nr:hypothetical protein H2199_008574 [Cladosporium sp. JES 115]
MPTKTCAHPPSAQSAHAAAKKEQKRLQKLNGGVIDVDPDVETQSYFVHTPYVSFHNPPRTLRRGSSKDGPVVCLIHSSLWWKEWVVQVGGAVEEEGVVDPRGVVGERFLQARDKTDEKSLRGYRVRSWRLWGETGKAFHRETNLLRKKSKTETNVDMAELGVNDDSTVSRKDHITRIEDEPADISPPEDEKNTPIISTEKLPTADQATRRYHFHYAGIDFYWKGTSTLRQSGFWGSWLHFNHLKLMAQLRAHPTAASEEADSDVGGKREVMVARYTSSICERKAGMLEVFDSAVLQLVREHMPSIQLDGETVSAELDEDVSSHIPQKEVDAAEDVAAVRRTRIYDLIISTTMCMVIGEAQKRAMVRHIVGLCLGEAGGAGG